jgi:VanZ family protein
MVKQVFRKQRKTQPPDSEHNALDYDKVLSKLDQEERAFIIGLIKRDPLSGLYRRGLLVYIILSILLLLWPFDFALLQKKNSVRWLGTVNGIEFPEEGQVLSASSTEGLCGRFLSGKGFTLEVWAATDKPNQTGPARIVSYSLNPAKRNFTLGQSKNKLIMRLRTTETDLNGDKPHVEVDNVFSFADPQHIVVAYDFSEQRIFVNGQMRLRQRVPAGRFTNWDPSYYLVLGNEATGDRPWIGKIFYLALYNRALSKQEIHRSYLAGWGREGLFSKGTSPVADGLVMRYLFEERKGDKIRSHKNTNAIPDLYIPKKIRIRENAYLSFEFGKPLKFSNSLGDAALNILVFVLLGLLFHAVLRNRYGSSFKTFAFVLVAGTLFTFGIESLQHLSVTRHSSFTDMLYNILGTTAGIGVDRFYETYLNRQIKFRSI